MLCNKKTHDFDKPDAEPKLLGLCEAGKKQMKSTDAFYIFKSECVWVTLRKTDK